MTVDSSNSSITFLNGLCLYIIALLFLLNLLFLYFLKIIFKYITGNTKAHVKFGIEIYKGGKDVKKFYGIKFNTIIFSCLKFNLFFLGGFLTMTFLNLTKPFKGIYLG